MAAWSRQGLHSTDSVQIFNVTVQFNLRYCKTTHSLPTPRLKTSLFFLRRQGGDCCAAGFYTHCEKLWCYAW